MDENYPGQLKLINKLNKTTSKKIYCLANPSPFPKSWNGRLQSYYYCYGFFCSWLTTIQLPGLYRLPEATGRDIFTCFCCCCCFVFLLKFLGFYFALISFVVAYIDNAFLNMRAVLASTIYLYLR